MIFCLVEGPWFLFWYIDGEDLALDYPNHLQRMVVLYSAKEITKDKSKFISLNQPRHRQDMEWNSGIKRTSWKMKFEEK